MNYQEQLAKLYKINVPNTGKWSLGGIKELVPSINYPTIHVAGTNGKGSVSTKIAATLTQAGYKVGLFTSPHISTFRERIQINGQMIDKDQCGELLKELFSKNAPKSSFFDYVTALGLLYFEREKVDIALIEVGLGGRLDSTNIIQPILSIITTIGLDHCEYLGDTVDKIAIEKGGIIKPNTPILIGPEVPIEPISKIAQSQNAPLIRITEKHAHFDVENQQTAHYALKLIEQQFPHELEAKNIGILQKPPCRLHKIENYPFPILLDVAHNPHGIIASLRSIKTLYPNQKIDILFGLSASKDIASCVKILQENASFLYPVEAKNPRAAKKELLIEELKKYQKLFASKNCFEETLALAINQAEKQGSILVILGSVFLMQQARNFFNIPQETDPYELNEQFAAN